MSTDLAVRDNVTVMQRAATAMTLVEMRERVEQLDGFYRGLMQKDTDYGEIPGTNKPTLYQPGAQLLCTFFGFAPIFEVLPASVEDWERGLFALTVRCRLTRQDGSTVAEGIGSCNSKEDKYRWRNAKPVCPDCGMEVRLSKNKPEWYCWQKMGGCGATFPKDEIRAGGRVENDEPWSLHNTILKMAEKRALVAATLNATGASRIFTQDVEDLPEFTRAPRPAVVDVTPPSDEPWPEVASEPDRPKAPSRDVERAARVTGAPLKQSRAAMVKSLELRLAHARRLGLDPEAQDADALSDDQLAAVLKSITAQITAVQNAQPQSDEEAPF